MMYIQNPSFELMEICLNMGWMNYQKAIFDTIEERDYYLLELEEKLGIRGLEVLKFKGDAKDLILIKLFQSYLWLKILMLILYL